MRRALLVEVTEVMSCNLTFNVCLLFLWKDYKKSRGSNTENIAIKQTAHLWGLVLLGA